jgi:hypothetical protein
MTNHPPAPPRLKRRLNWPALLARLSPEARIALATATLPAIERKSRRREAREAA